MVRLEIWQPVYIRRDNHLVRGKCARWSTAVAGYTFTGWAHSYPGGGLLTGHADTGPDASKLGNNHIVFDLPENPEWEKVITDFASGIVA